MKILPIISPKGGEGKSTLAAYTAGFLADAGLKTLLIDADWSQPTASSIFPLTEEAPFGLSELLMQTVADPSQMVSRSAINNMDVIYSNDPNELLPTSMLHAADGRLRLKNTLQHPYFASYDAIIVDSKGATGVMTELCILASTGKVMGVVKPILPDVREFIRGSLHLFARLKTYENYGITLPEISILINCIKKNELLDTEAIKSLTGIISQKQYDHSFLGERDLFRLLETTIEDLTVFKLGHVREQPVHRLEYKTRRVSSPAAAVIMHSLVSELFPEWKEKFDTVLSKEIRG